jgi:hypothetical protein
LLDGRCVTVERPHPSLKTTILAFSTAAVLTVEQFKERVTGAAKLAAATKAA